MARKQEWYTVNDDESLLLDDATVRQRAQTFTLGTTGNNLTFNITQIKVKVKKTLSPGTSVIDIQGVQPDGSPDGVVISTGNLTEAIVTGTAGWVTVTMSTGALEAGQKYALVIKASASADASNYYEWRADGTSPAYTGGQIWASADTGVSWTSDGTTDFMFQIEGGSYDGTLCTLADAVNKMGANASTGAVEEVLVSDFVRQAEGTINAVTRFNWVDAYSTLTDEVKFILNDVASNYAAIYGISYDMAGFTDRVEAETMINVYREAIARGLSLLRNQEVRKFITGDT